MLQWLEPRYLVKIVSTYTLFCTERQPSDLCIHMKKQTNHFPSCQWSHYLDCIHTFCYLKLPQNNIRISRTPNLSLTQEFGVVNENTLLISQTQNQRSVVFYLPKIIPPLDGHEVAKPLMSHLMSNHHGHPFLVDCRTFRAIIDEVGFPIRD